MLRRQVPRLCGLALAAGLALGSLAHAGDEHWSREFAKPKSNTDMGPGTGLSDGGGSPSIHVMKWHAGKLWIGGVWEPGVTALDLTKRQPNEYWYLWTWSPEHGYQVVCQRHTAQGGQGPDGVVSDFLWLPDGRMVVAGQFMRLDNPGGNRYHGVNALAVFDPNEPGPDKWRPLGGPQYNGTVDQGGVIHTLAYDPQADELWMGGTSGGIRMPNPPSPKIHRYSFKTKSYEPAAPGVLGQKPEVHKIRIDASTTPSTIYVAGRFQYTGGNGQNPALGPQSSTARYSVGFASYQDGKGWTTYPSKRAVKKKEEILQRAGDFMHFDAPRIFDFLIDGKDIWAVGAFSEGEGSGQTLRGIARWDADREVWTDPTGKGGVGREVWNIAKATDGKIYFAGAFGARKGAKEFFDGFKNGDKASMVLSYDPATKAWDTLGSGLSGNVMPEVRMCVGENGDVFFGGNFEYIGPQHFESDRTAKPEFASYYLARWNAGIDFVKNPPAKAAANAPFELAGPGAKPITKPQATGNEQWSRQFPFPPRATGAKSNMSGRTGMDLGRGTPDTMGIAWLGDTLYFAGNWEAASNERWYVWSWHPEKGWNKHAWQGPGGKGEGVQSKPEGVKAHDGKLYVYGAISGFSGIAIFDPVANTWSKLTGTHEGKAVEGNTALGGTGVVSDIAWDSKNGDLYLVGNWSSTLERTGDKYPKYIAAAIKVAKDGTYTLLGRDLAPEDPAKPIKGLYAIYLDETKDPTDIYVGGTFNYYGELPTTNKRMAYNVARYDHAAKDWAPLGKGVTRGLSELDKGSYPEGLPGLPARTDDFSGFLTAIFPRVRCLTMDKEGNLYAGGSLAVIDDALPVKDRKETFGIAKLDKATGRWVSCTKAGGVSRDIFQMTWLDDARTKLLLSGGFVYDNQFEQLHCVAILDTQTGELSRLGGGLLRSQLEHVISSNVVHAVKDGEYWFAGLFDHAGINANSRLEAPVESVGVARFAPGKNLDPNRGLSIGAVEPIAVPPGPSSTQVSVKLTATLADGPGEVQWFERRTDGNFTPKGKGLAYTASLRAKLADGEAVLYVNVKRPDGSEGGKIPVRIPIVAKAK